ncbi:cupin domain-containing protein [Aerophototrophica crusticola]|uniref:Cupin domain-containing protein n=1 Tax=Aerophototrophica crusticola TaxID=1709002 RepID=A0A858R4M1_9PROT|nr:cupin domain-containing protein [Rhodospirillaceae bacterium B3]
MTTSLPRPACIRHWTEIQEPDDATYPGDTELMSIGSPFGRVFGFARIGIHHEVLPPGRRTSWPHAESTEEEFVYVLEGEPDLWLDGHLHRLGPGDGVGFKPGTGETHCILNNSDRDVRLLVVGEHKRADNKVYYPLHPRRAAEIGERHWKDWPARPLGPHDGKARKP